MPIFPYTGTIAKQDANAVDITGGTIQGATLTGNTLDGGTNLSAVAQMYKLPRGTLANLDTAAGANALVVGQLYYITDEDAFAVALTVSTYSLLKSALTLLDSISVSGTTFNSANLTPNAYSIYVVQFNGISHNSGVATYLKCRLSDDNAVSWTSYQQVGPSMGAADTCDMGFNLIGRNKFFTGEAVTNTNTTSKNFFNPTKTDYCAFMPNGITTFGFAFNAGSGDAGTIDIYGI